MWRQKAEQGFQQGRLAAAIRPEQGKHLTRPQGQRDRPADLALWIAIGEIDGTEAHDQPPRADASSQMKKGVPITAVRMPSGVSTGPIVRASVSMIKR